jgi:prephenate dehydratase
MSEMEKTAFLGPVGTWAEEALRASTHLAEGEAVPYPTVTDVVEAVSSGEVARGIVPIENSLEGSVRVTLDILAFEVDDVRIAREIVLPIHHCLISRSEMPLERIELILSHPHASAQCRKFMRAQLPQAEVKAANSTAEAVRIVSEGEEDWAAIGSRLAAEKYGCIVLSEAIEDHPGNQTRFVVLSREEAPQGLDEPYKTSIVCAIAHDQPGSLLQILQEFAFRSINLTKIESRPSKKGLGDYVFFIDMEGKKDDAAIASALECLGCKLASVKLLGSYPLG